MNLNKYCLKNGTVFYQDKLQQLDIEVEDGIVTAIGQIDNSENIIDCSNKLITPGFIDVHVHLRTPGFSHKEDISSGTMAALHGGFTHICSMPNTNPCLDDVNTIVKHLSEIEKYAKCRVYPFSAVSTSLSGQELVDIDNIAKLNVAGFSDDGKGVQDNNLMLEALIKAGRNDKLISAHCEDELEFIDGMGCIGLGQTSERHHLKAISNKSEYAMIARDLDLIKDIHDKHHYQYHVCHLSTSESLELIREAKKNNFNVSCEVTPHHLISDESEIDVNNANYKMNPPLRSKNDVAALVAGLNDKTIEVIATDHAPHTKKEKSVSIETAPFGIIGLELAFSLLNTHLIKSGKVSLETILRCLTVNPSRIFKINNQLTVKSKAYLNIIDLDKKVKYSKENLYSKSANTFYLNDELMGMIEMTIFEDKQYNWLEEE